MNSRTLLYIPIETKVREYHGKLLLSMYAARAGFDVVLGGHTDLQKHLLKLPTGLVLERNVNQRNRMPLERASMRGHRLTAWCEEGISIFDKQQYGARRIDRDAISVLDSFFAWGKVQADAIASWAPNTADRIVLTGNPRFDLLREPYRQLFARQADALRKEHGPYILLNSSFSIYNNHFGFDHFLQKMMWQPKDSPPDYQDFLEKWYEHIKNSFFAFVELMPVLSKTFPDHNIVVRPHPSENRNVWREKTKDLPNVKVIFEGSALPWILGADALLHNNCTTSIEAHVLGRPTVSYLPCNNPRFNHEVPQAVSVTAFTADEVVTALQNAVKQNAANTLSPEDQKIFDDHACATEGAYSCEHVIASLLELEKAFKAGTLPKRLGTLGRVFWHAKNTKRRTRAFLGRLRGSGKRYETYSKSKYDGIELDEMRADLEQFQALSAGITKNGNAAPVTVMPMQGAEDCFLVTCADKGSH